jgi:DNA-binding transcriptional regulator YiaG
MPNVAQVLKEEITRLARKEIRSTCDPLRSQVRALRSKVRSQEREIAKLSKALAKMVDQSAGTKTTLYAPEEAPTRARVTPASIRRHRLRLGLSQADLAQLLGVSTNTVVRWEAGTSGPRAHHRNALIRIRDLGVREATKMLEG